MILFVSPVKVRGIWASNIFIFLYVRSRYSTWLACMWLVYSCLPLSILVGSFLIKVVFRFVLQSNTFFSCKHLPSCSACFSWIDKNTFIQNAYVPSWPGVFQFSISLSVALGKQRRIFSSGLSSSSSDSFFFYYYLSIHHFRYGLYVSIFYSKIDLFH